MEITLTKPQSEIFLSSTRHRVAACGRRFGKTLCSIYAIIEAASIPKSKIWYVTASFRMAKSIVWQDLKDALYVCGWIDKVNESDLSIKLINRSTIVLRGAENYDSLRGSSLDFVVIDEAAFCPQKAWTEAIRPTLSDSGGRALFISSPQGRDWFYDLWRKGQEGNDKDPEWESFQYTTLQGGNVPEAEIEAARRDLDEKTFNQEYRANFITYSGLIYYSYDSVLSTFDHKYKPDRGVLVALDFNVNPMSACIAQKEGDKMYVFDEILLYSSNTDEMADEIRSRYPIEKTIIYPDPAATQRKTSAGGKTDLSILQNYGFRVRHRHHHPYVRDRINAVNSRLLSSDGVRHLFISPKCRHVHESLAKMSYKEGTSIPNKQSGFDHMTDALGYMCEFLHPVRRGGGSMASMRLSGL